MAVDLWFSSSALDVAIALLFPLLLILAGRKLLPPFSWADIRQLLTEFRVSSSHPFSLHRAYSSFVYYDLLAKRDAKAMECSYGSIGRAHKQLGYKIGYPSKLTRLKQAIVQNTGVTTAIAALAAQEELSLRDNVSLNGINQADLGRVRESLKHYVRDWSEEGASEREKIFSPILRVLEQIPKSRRAGTRVLVPGSGLGRLAWEISDLGFNTTAVEFSYFMTLAMRFLFSSTTTRRANQHSIQPFAHWFSHQRSNQSLFRTVSFPDVVPRFSSNLQLIEGDFLKMLPPADKSGSGSIDSGYDFIVTLFFIDTSVNVFSTIEKIYHLLRPGGVWVNLGPLLWPGGAQAKVELSFEEVMHTVKTIGFSVQSEGLGDDIRSPRTIECEYTSDKNAMMRWIYRAEFWVATK